MSTPVAITRTCHADSPVLWASGTLAALAVWIGAWMLLVPFTDRVISILPVVPGSRLGDAVAFFAYEVPKVLLLLALVVFGMGIVRSFFSVERTRALLAGKREGAGTVAAASLGI